MKIPKKTEDRLEKMIKQDAVLDMLLEYVLSDIRLSDGKTTKLTIIDYFCLTDIKPTEIQAHLRRNRQEITGLDRYLLNKFLLQYQDLGEIMTKETLKEENLVYIINDEKKEITDDMWDEILTKLQEHNIVPYQKVTAVASRRLIRKESLLPLIDIAEKENKPIQYIKK